MSFLTPIFLFATAAAAIPVVLHLVRQVKAKPVPFSSLMFIPATTKETVRRRRLKDRLLMSIRMLILALLALVFARPFLPQEQLPFVPERQAESVVVLLDRSLSMRYDGAFERALEAVQDRLSSAGSSDEAALIVFDSQADLLAPLSSDPGVVQAALSKVEAGYGSTDYLPALQRGVDLLAEGRNPHRVILLASDLQESAWDRIPVDWQLPAGVTIEPLSVADNERSNAYVEAFKQTTRRTGEASLVRYDARIASSEVLAARAVTLSVNGVELDRTAVPARATAPITFEHSVSRSGYTQGVLSLEEDLLPEDDRFYFTRLSAAPPAIVVVDAPSRTGRRDAFYLRTAFDLGDASRFRFANEQRVSQAVLRDASVAFVSAPDASPEVLRRFVEDGGTLVLSPYDGVPAARFSDVLESLDVGSASAIADPRADQGFEAIIGEVDSRHPIFAPLSSGSMLLRPRFRQYVEVTPASGAVVIGKFDTGDPFLIEKRIGDGRVLVYTSTINGDWSDLALDEVFVPLVYQIATYGTQRDRDDLVYFVGDAVTVSGEPNQRWDVRTPEGEVFRVTLDDAGRGAFRDTHVPGHYVMESGSDRRLFSVNVDPAESALATRDVQEVYAAISAPPGNREPTAQTVASAVDDEANQKLWRILLLIVLALFAVESWLANREKKQAEVTRLNLPRAA